jgi:hypothetical protein
MSSRSLMHRVSPPSEPPDGEHPQSFHLVVGGTQLRGSWYLSAIVRLQGFSSCSPAAPLRRRSPKTVTSSSMAGESKPGCASAPPSASRIFIISAGEGSVPSWGQPPRGRWPAPSLSDRGKGVRRSWRWQLPRAWLSDPSGFKAAPGATFRHGSWKRFFRRRDSWGRPWTDLQLYGLLPVLASRVWARAGASWQLEAEVVVVAAAGAGDGEPFVGLLLLRRPPNRVGLFVPAEVEPGFRL